MGRLDVRVCAARNLADTEMFSKPDPYAVVKLENQTHRTRVIDNNLNPQWDEVFKFTVADENSSQLRVELWNKNVLSDEFLGQYSLSIAGLTKGVVKDGWYLLQQSKSNAELHVRLLAVDFGITSESQQPPASATVLMAAAPNFQAPTFAATQPPLPIPPPPPPPQPVQGIPLQQHSSTLPLGATSPSCYPTNYYTNDVSCAAAPPSAYYSPQQTQPHPYSVGNNNTPFVEVVHAWYGTDAQHSDNNGRVPQQIREIIQRNNGRIVLDGNLNGLFGFDPVFGQIKVCAMHVRYNGQDQHLRAFESQPFYFP